MTVPPAHQVAIELGRRTGLVVTAGGWGRSGTRRRLDGGGRIDRAEAADPAGRHRDPAAARTSLPFLKQAPDDAVIAYRAESSSLVYQADEIRDLMAVLRVIADPGASALAVERSLARAQLL